VKSSIIGSQGVIIYRLQTMLCYHYLVIKLNYSNTAVWLRFMFRHGFLKVMILTFYAHIYVFDADNELRLHKRVVTIKYLLRVVLNFNSFMFIFYFNWMRVNEYCILWIINILLIFGNDVVPKGSDEEILEPETIIIILIVTALKVLEEGGLW
jgi:hypothetical protein